MMIVAAQIHIGPKGNPGSRSWTPRPSITDQVMGARSATGSA
jgi:hypothetical protein